MERFKHFELASVVYKTLGNLLSISKQLIKILPGEAAGQAGGACLFVHSRLRQTLS